jgi:Xaa-Pro aminopeptidase
MRFVFGLLCALLPLTAAGVARDEYRARRTELRKSLDGVLVLFGANESDDLHDAFFQESNFFYLSGWQEPGAALILTAKEEILFLPPRDEHDERYNGHRTAAGDPGVTGKTGFAKVLPRSALESQFLRLTESSSRIYSLSDAIPPDVQAQKLKRIASLHDHAPAADLIAKLRVKKSPAEIDLIRKATDASVAAHLAAWKRMKPGLHEYEIAATMVDTYSELGCERSAYAPIVGSGPNGVILHYSANRRRMDAGEVAVIDVGAECSGYTSDVTRTVPVNGKFSPRERELYNIVLGAQKAAIAAMKPGVKVRGDPKSLYQIAYDYINTHGKDLHGEPLGKYFNHGLSHYIGLDVHDPGDINVPLEPGMVISIEPGVYIAEENIGIRIEDTVVVTETGSDVLSAALPKEP